MSQQIFLLSIKKSKKNEGTTYCIGVHRLGTPNMEFIMGEVDDNLHQGAEVEYIYNADYTSNLQSALDWLDKKK